MGVPGEAVSLARQGILGEANWMGDNVKSVLYKWIGRRSADWIRDSERTPSAPASMINISFEV